LYGCAAHVGDIRHGRVHRLEGGRSMMKSRGERAARAAGLVHFWPG
jgi:hypothetical protein